MTETNTTFFPPGRYGRRREPRRTPRWLLLTLIGLMVAGAIGVSQKLYRAYGITDFSANLVAYHDITDSQVVIDFIVHKPEGQSASCTVRARNRAGAEVGRAEVAVPPPGTQVRISYTLSTTGPPIHGETVGCTRLH